MWPSLSPSPSPSDSEQGACTRVSARGRVPGAANVHCLHGVDLEEVNAEQLAARRVAVVLDAQSVRAEREEGARKEPGLEVRDAARGRYARWPTGVDADERRGAVRQRRAEDR